jgi:hypothetical protein
LVAVFAPVVCGNTADRDANDDDASVILSADLSIITVTYSSVT